MYELIEIQNYYDNSGKSPYRSWFKRLDVKVQLIIDNRFLRVRLGNFGDCESLKQGLYELKIDFGPGYRIYFGEINKKLILLIGGGDKSTQSRDI